MIAEIIAVGSEMLTPFRQDTNSLFLTDRLNDLGVTVAFKTIVGDSLEHLTEAARIALRRADLVLFSGGLGPTEDDLTREALAAALNLGTHPDAATLESLEARFAERGLTMTANNRKQADILDTAILLPNSAGTAPGQFLQANTPNGPRIAILLPGPPRELKTVFDEQCRSRLAAILPERHLAKRLLRILLVPESHADARTAPIYTQFPDVETTILAHAGEIQFHLMSVQATAAEAQSRVDDLAARMSAELADDLISDIGQSPEEVVLARLRDRHQTLAVAESCTGGLLASRLTAIAGSSAVFLGGAIVYANSLKQGLAGVPADLLATQRSRLRRSRRSPPPTASASARPHPSPSPSPASPAQREPHQANPSASSTSPCPHPRKPPPPNSTSRATATASAGGPPSTPSSSFTTTSLRRSDLLHSHCIRNARIPFISSFCRLLSALRRKHSRRGNPT